MCSNSKWFRSAEMKHVMIFTPEECAFDLIHTLGNMGVMQFDDLNTHKTAFQRTYAASIKRCEEIERILSYIKGEAESMGVTLRDPPEITDFLNRTDGNVQQNTQANERISQMEKKLTLKEKEIRELQKTYAKLLDESNRKRELKYVLREALKLHQQRDNVMEKTEITSDMGARIRFSRVTGVINTSDRSAFHRLVFRFSRGSCYLRFFDIFEGPDEEEVVFTDPVTGEPVTKSVFIAVFPGSKLRDKIDKICEAFGARIHDVPDEETAGAFESQIRDVMQYLNESQQYLNANRQRTRNILIGLASNYYQMMMQIRSMKGVYHVLNKCYVRKTGFVAARGWMLADKMDRVQRIVRTLGGVKGGGLTESSGTSISSSPPTYFKTNKFTSVFQNTVDIYGVPRYQEANPALFTAVTFPFLFGVMFGDIGHGVLFTMLGMYLVFNEDNLSKVKNMNEMMKMAYDGRYMLLLMGLFAVYCGFIYNEFLCLGLDLFGSTYVTNSTMDRFYTKSKRTNYWLDGGVEAYGNTVYPFGLDPIWHMVPNELTFVNSFKMKISVLLGVTQMTAGIALKWSNAIYFKDDLTFYFECIPQMLFMCCLFVYMCVLILYKWTIDWQEAFKNNVQAPSLINTMINMALTMGGRGTEAELYSGQDTIQLILIVTALLCVPAMLIPKPLLLHRRHVAASSSSSSSSSDGYVKVQTEEPDDDEMGEEKKEEDEDLEHTHKAHAHEETLLDLFIEQGIETIEFVLSCVSNTASYLRLWALSLAHAELAKTFWEMTMAGAINSESSMGFLFITVGYAVFSASTFAVLLVMDPLECVLHALRLHWVEFQNKFYKADGTAFRPFCYKSILRPVVDNTSID